MKKLLNAALLTLLLLLNAARGENAIYLGTEVTRFTSVDESGETSVKIYAIYDRAAKKLTGVAYFGFGTQMNYVKLPVTDVVEVVVGDERKIGRTLTVLGSAQRSDAALEAALLKGVNSKVTIRGTVAVDLPKVLTGNAFGASAIAGSQPARLVQVRTTARLQLDLSRESNDSNSGAGETIEDARERVITLLKAKGFTEQPVSAS